MVWSNGVVAVPWCTAARPVGWAEAMLGGRWMGGERPSLILLGYGR